MPDDQRQAAEGSETSAAIDAEIADHLATAAERLKTEGVSEAEAMAKAEARFGDAAAVSRRCYWIQQGDSLMIRGAVIAFLGILGLSLIVTAIGSWQSQVRMTQQMTALTEQLKVIAERPPAATPAAVASPLELSGQLYVGNPNRPAANQEVRIVNVKDGSVVRRVMADKDGHYRSGPLPAGDYAIAGEIQQPRSGEARYLQSAPAYVYPGAPLAACNLDLAYRAGRIKLELSRPLPTLTVEGKYTIDSRLMIRVYSKERAYRSPWTTQQTMPAKWPAYLVSAVVPPEPQSGMPYISQFFELLSNRDLSDGWATTMFARDEGLLPDGQASLVAAMLLDVIPEKSKLPPIPALASDASERGRQNSYAGSGGFRGGRGGAGPTLTERWEVAVKDVEVETGMVPISLREGSPWTEENDDFVWMTKGLGQLWLANLYDPPEPRLPHIIHTGWVSWSGPIDVPIADGQVTRLRIDIPTDMETRLRDFVETAQTAAEFAKRVPHYVRVNQQSPHLEDAVNDNNNPFVRPVSIAVVGTEPVKEPAGQRP